MLASVGWKLFTAWATDKRASSMQRLIGEGLTAQTRDELAATVRTLNLALGAPQMLYESFADKLPINEGEQDG